MSPKQIIFAGSHLYYVQDANTIPAPYLKYGESVPVDDWYAVVKGEETEQRRWKFSAFLFVPNYAGQRRKLVWLPYGAMQKPTITEYRPDLQHGKGLHAAMLRVGLRHRR